MTKSKAIKIQKDDFGFSLVDNELEKYDLKKVFPNHFPFHRPTHRFKKSVRIGNAGNLHTTMALTGEGYIILPLRKHSKELFLPEMSLRVKAVFKMEQDPQR